MNGLKTASCLLKGRGHGKNPCDTDTGHERSVGGLAFYQPSLMESAEEQKGLKADTDAALFLFDW